MVKNFKVGDEKLDKFYDGVECLTKVANSLWYLSDCFHGVGNTKVGKDLSLAANDIMKSVEDMKESFQGQIVEKARMADESSKRMMEVALTMPLLQMKAVEGALKAVEQAAKEGQ